jgi:transcriptional regulator with XRE-family HTH domain
MAIGEKIKKLRKQHGLSQEALAEKVTVTRQTISKWELGQSTPDLDFIAQLSDIFHVSSDYLIKDEMVEPDELPYRKRSYCLSEKSKRIILVIASAAALIAGSVSLICDYFTSESLSWSLITVAAIMAAWLMILPSLTARTKIVLKTLLVVSIVPIPLLAVLSLLLKKSVIFTLGICITLTAIAAIWAIYGIFRKLKKNIWRAFGFSLLVLVPVPIAMIHLSARFLPQVQFDFTSDIFNSGITIALSLVCFGLDYLFAYRKGDVTEEK